MIYPAVQHKIPELFKLIILCDTTLDITKKTKVVNLPKYRENLNKRREYSHAAEKYVQRQKGGTN